MPAPAAPALPAGLAGALSGFELAASADPVKTDLEVRCTRCGRHLCDAEHGDSLEVLARVALGHDCDPTQAASAADGPATAACGCGADLDPGGRHGRGCDLYDGWRE